MAIELSEVVPWGRSFDEYQRMFALSENDLAGEILGCGDGPASFNAEATVLGHRVVSCDPIYAFSREQIAQRVYACRDDMLAQVNRDLDGFVWTYIRDPEHLGELRIAAMQKFLDDFECGKSSSRYVTAALPGLPFDNARFGLALSSHFLFLYSHLLDLDFHVAAIDELLRVAAELRIFPLLDLKRTTSQHLEPVQTHFRARGFNVEVVPVDYEFQRGGNQMLRIRRS